MGRGKSRPDGQYEVKVTVDHDFEGKAIRKSFYSSKSKADARRKADEYKIELAIKKQNLTMSSQMDLTMSSNMSPPSLAYAWAGSFCPMD